MEREKELASALLEPQKFQCKTGEEICVRLMVEDDFDAVEELAESVHWTMGAHNIRLYFQVM